MAVYTKSFLQHGQKCDVTVEGDFTVRGFVGGESVLTVTDVRKDELEGVILTTIKQLEQHVERNHPVSPAVGDVDKLLLRLGFVKADVG